MLVIYIYIYIIKIYLWDRFYLYFQSYATYTIATVPVSNLEEYLHMIRATLIDN